MELRPTAMRLAFERAVEGRHPGDSPTVARVVSLLKRPGGMVPLRDRKPRRGKH